MSGDELVRFFALRRIKPHTPPLVQAPVNSFEFHTCVHTPQAEDLLRLLQHRVSPTLSPHRLRRGLLGYLILFAPHAFVPQHHYRPTAAFATGVPPYIYAFTATHGIPPSSPVLQLPSFQGSPWLTMGFYPGLREPPAHPLRPMIPDNARHLRITAAAGT